MGCTLVKALDVLEQIKSSPELPPLEYSSVVALIAALESFLVLEHEFDALDAQFTSATLFLASREAEYVPLETLTSELQDVLALEREMPAAEKTLTDLWEVGPYLRASVLMISSWLPVHKQFLLQPDDIFREMARIRLRQCDVVKKVREVRQLLKRLEALASLGGAIGAMNLDS